MSLEAYFMQWRPSGDLHQTNLPLKARHMMLFMDVLHFLLSWTRMGTICVALVWLCYRAFRVLSKPVNELIALLRFDIPVTPCLSILFIDSNEALLHVKLSDNGDIATRCFVLLNGICVGEINQEETISITGLQSNHFYCLRTITHSTSGFQSTGSAVRLRTKPSLVRNDTQQPSINDKDVHPSATESAATSDRQPCMEIVSTTAAQSLLPTTVLENRTNTCLPRKNSGVKKAGNDELASAPSDSASSECEKSKVSIRYYSDKLETVRNENDELERILLRESHDFEVAQSELTKRISDLKRELKRKEADSKEQKRKIAELEKHALVSQQKKSSEEKSLKGKVVARKKHDDNISQWDREVILYHKDIEKMKLDKDKYSEQAAKELHMQRQIHRGHVQMSKSLEEEIHTIGTSMEQLKDLKRRQEDGDWQQDPQKLVLDNNSETDKKWENQINLLQSRYTSAWNQLQHAKMLQNQMQQRIDMYTSNPVNLQQTLPPTPVSDDIADKRTNSRHRRIGTNNVELNYPPLSTFIEGGPSQVHAPKSGSPPNEPSYLSSFVPATRSVNRFSQPTSQPVETSPQSDSFPGGAISPSAGDLLPAGLLGDDTALYNDLTGSRNDVQGRVRSALPGLGAAIPGLGAPSSNEQTVFGSTSPSTPASGSPNLLSSPHHSSGNIYFSTTSDHFDQDHRSVKSATSSLKGSNANTLSRASGTRFGNLFGLNRQRGKTLPDSGPVMGTLKPSESQSMPQSENAALEGSLFSRRRGSHSGAGHPVDDLRGGFDEKAEKTTQLAIKDGYFRRKAFNMFGNRTDPWAPQPIGKRSSPRPTSLGSTDMYQSRPSSQSKQQYGWSFDTNYNTRRDLDQQEIGLQVTSPWAQPNSRRPSLTGSHALFLESDKVKSTIDTPQIQPPIGTRPEGNKIPTPRLNPNAPNFKSLFIREKKSHRTEEIEMGQSSVDDNSNEQSIQRVDESSDGQHLNLDDSEDGQAGSSTFDTESYSSHELTKHDSTPDGNSAPIPSSNAQGKETLMQKISRKSSASKFTFSNFKNKDGIFSSRPKDRSPAVNADLETDEESVGKDGETTMSSSPNADNAGAARASGISWSSLKRMGKRGDKTPSVTESITSVIGDDDE